jgi:hypothetical protein
LEGFEKPSDIPFGSETENPLVDVSMSPDVEKKKRKPYTKRVKEDEIDIVDGEDIQMFIDLILPIAISGIHNMTSPNKMSPDSIMLTHKQEEKMNRLAQRAADRMKVSMNPFLALAIGVSVAYGGNYMKNKP